MSYEFKAWPKIPRLSKMQCSITEKLDGTNAQISITKDFDPIHLALQYGAVTISGEFAVFAGSRTRWLGRDKGQDNFGFATWVYENADALVKELGEGTHYGEWWGQGIQRTYGLTKKYFTLFNPWRYGCGQNPAIPVAKEQIERDTLLGVVPILSQEQYSPTHVGETEYLLTSAGSQAVTGWMKPEGFVVCIANEKYKVVLNGDDNKRAGS